MSERHVALLGPHQVETDKVKRSRFIGVAGPCTDADNAAATVSAVRARFHDARHHAWAWKTGGASRASDDGEPHHSAGPPILREIEGRGLDDVVVVVVRYYGGVKLGTGGLVRAYGGAAAAVLEDAPKRTLIRRIPLSVTYDYGAASGMQRALHGLRLTPAKSDYAAQVTLTLHLASDQVDAVCDALRDASGGAAALAVGQPISVPED
jgi:uncharacterized YigZ family protein